MLVNHNFQIFLIFLEFYFNKIISFLYSFYYYITIYQLYEATHVTFPLWTVRGKAISEFRSPNALPRAPTPLGTGTSVTSSMCNGLTFVCMLRCWTWCVVPIWFLYASILNMIRCTDPIPVYSHTSQIYRTGRKRPLPCSRMKRQPGGDGIGPGCCGGGVITTWSAGGGVIAAESAVWAAGEFWPCRNAFSRLTET